MTLKKRPIPPIDSNLPLHAEDSAPSTKALPRASSASWKKYTGVPYTTASRAMARYPSFVPPKLI